MKILISLKIVGHLFTTVKMFMNTIVDEVTIKQKLSCDIISLPRRITRYTVLRSPHVDKKSREQFEFRYYNYLCVISLNNVIEVSNLLERILKYNIDGISCKVSIKTLV